MLSTDYYSSGRMIITYILLKNCLWSCHSLSSDLWGYNFDAFLVAGMSIKRATGSLSTASHDGWYHYFDMWLLLCTFILFLWISFYTLVLIFFSRYSILFIFSCFEFVDVQNRNSVQVVYFTYVFQTAKLKKYFATTLKYQLDDNKNLTTNQSANHSILTK